MSLYPSRYEPWHDSLPIECSCQPAWKDRDLQDDACDYHRLIDAVEWLRDEGWKVEPPT